ncbi:hypothetical protein B0J11DRAFT_506875 [Dendryphion nanum]|uniref:Uncharacterized protein n=1 Tax=Dendryphion nanum TaxID=256645 RepID=A0A9P9DNC4_9PLEO|nr:hypothetical protein B0J11DRAFT_506875 [Dendryphion nanum]
MASRIDDRWFWLGLGAFTFFAVKGVAYGLRTIVTLTEVHTPPPKPTIPSAAARNEDAIKISSLETLALCNNVEIRKASTRILCERFITDNAACALLWKDLDSRNPLRVRRAELALRLLDDYGVLRECRASYNRNFSMREDLVEVPLPRRSRNSNEERELRRRRREAMFFNEGDRPISQEDVWMRDDTGLMGPDFARDLAGLTADMTRVDAEVQALMRSLHPGEEAAAGVDSLMERLAAITSSPPGPDADVGRLEREGTPSPSSSASSSETSEV